MIIQTAITREMLDELKTSGVLMSKTNFNAHAQAYNILSEYKFSLTTIREARVVRY